MQLFIYIRQCLTTEFGVIQQASGESVPGLSMKNSGAETLHKIDILKRRTQVSCINLISKDGPFGHLFFNFYSRQYLLFQILNFVRTFQFT